MEQSTEMTPELWAALTERERDARLLGQIARVASIMLDAKPLDPELRRLLYEHRAELYL